MQNLKIVKAIYYAPEIGIKKGTDVTDELSAQIINDRLFYNGIYNRIFPDNFVGKHKKLKVEVEYKRKKFIKFYNENEKINLPIDSVGFIKEEEWKWWVGIILAFLGLLAAIFSIFYKS